MKVSKKEILTRILENIGRGNSYDFTVFYKPSDGWYFEDWKVLKPVHLGKDFDTALDSVWQHMDVEEMVKNK